MGTANHSFIVITDLVLNLLRADFVKEKIRPYLYSLMGDKECQVIDLHYIVYTTMFMTSWRQKLGH